MGAGNVKKRSKLAGCAAAALGLCCGGGGLGVLGLGRYVSAKAASLESTRSAARELGLITDPNGLVVDVPASQDGRRALALLQKKWSKDEEVQRAMNRMRRSVVLYIAGYAKQEEFDRLVDQFLSIDGVIDELRKVARMEKWSNPRPSADPKVKFEWPANGPDAIQFLCLAAILEARKGDATGAKRDLELATNLVESAFCQPVAWYLYTRLYEEIVVLRAAEQCAKAIGWNQTSADLLSDISHRMRALNFREGLRGQPAIDGLLIDSPENKLWNEAPFGKSIRDLYKASINDYWSRSYNKLPRDLDDLDVAEKVFKSMRREANQNPVIMNGASSPSFLIDMGRDLLARRRLIDAAIDMLNGKNVTQIDPYSGQVLKQTTRNGRIVIYSFARDRKDDHGKPRGRGSNVADHFDLIFEMPKLK